jgi:uncharacterized membrane protein
MSFYPTIMTLHIICAGIWLVAFFMDTIFKNKIKSKFDNPDKQVISLYLLFGNLFGSIGSIGILITGILMVSMNPGYGFFDMTANHWLATKQIIMVIILIIIFAQIVPTGKKLKREIENNLEENSTEELKGNLNKMFKINASVNGLVVLNLLLAITHRFIG